MRVLALEPYYGGSHQAFLDAWIRGSHHDWTLLTLPAYKWKWRMRHAALTFADEISARCASGERWDLLLASDMLDLAQLRGLVPGGVHALPAVVYFHENQLTYPVRVEKERDLHFAWTNLITAMTADEVWFNSAFHRDELLTAGARLAKRMPDYPPTAAIQKIRNRSHIWPQGVEEMPPRGRRRPGPLRILWAARWEFDKGPETFFEALEIARSAGADFRLSVLGEQFQQVPAVFARARRTFEEHIDHWGFLSNRADYVAALGQADVVVSTAKHEFFGVGVVEAMAAGCWPLLPRRLAYPEILADFDDTESCFYDGSAHQLAARLVELADRRHDLWQGEPDRGRQAVARFAWPVLRPQLDQALGAVRRRDILPTHPSDAGGKHED